MKKQIVVLTLVAMMVSPAVFAEGMQSHSGMAMMGEGHSQGDGMQQDAQSMTKVYQCSMDGYASDKPGKCPKCGMNLEEKQMTAEAAKVALEKSQAGK